MNEILFFGTIAILIFTFLSRDKIVEYLFENFDIEIGTEVIVYIVSILFIIVIIMGMLMDDTKEKYGQISENYDKLRPKVENKPHRYFDIDFDSLFPKN